jgi:hypothetical protein
MPIGSVIAGIMGSGGASAAGAAAGQAGIQAYKNAQTERARNQALISPWTSVGAGAQNALAQLYGLGHLDASGDPTFGGSSLNTSNIAGDRANALANFSTSPGYDWRVGQGIKALDRSAAAKGMLLSGAQAKGINDYGQQQGSQEFGNYTNALMGLSGAGLQGQLNTDNTNASITNKGNELNYGGALAQASSYSSAANALANGISGGINSLGSILGYGLGGGFDNIFSGGGSVSPVAAPAGGYGGYAGYANTLPGFSSR